jgi:hypothetical protein
MVSRMFQTQLFFGYIGLSVLMYSKQDFFQNLVCSIAVVQWI